MMNTREQNTQNKEIIYAKKKLWSENDKEVFNTSISEYFGIEAVTTKKASNHLNREKAFLDKQLKELVKDAESANFIRSFKLNKEIDRLNKTRELIATSLSKLTGYQPYELVIVNSEDSGNGTPYDIESYADFMKKLTAVYKVKEISEEEYELLFNQEHEGYNRKERLDTQYESKINIICILQTFLQVMFIYYLFDGSTAQLSKIHGNNAIIIYLLVPIWWMFIQPWVVKKVFKKPA